MKDVQRHGGETILTTQARILDWFDVFDKRVGGPEKFRGSVDVDHGQGRLQSLQCLFHAAALSALGEAHSVLELRLDTGDRIT